MRFYIKQMLIGIAIISSIFVFLRYYYTSESVTSRKNNILDTNQRANHGDSSSIIIYNRVPKTGSTTFMGLAYELCKQNNYHVLHLNLSKNAHTLNLLDQRRFIENITSWHERQPAIYHGHVAYLDFLRFGYPNPIYINLIREPIDRFVSYYYFLRYGDDFRPHLIRRKAGNTETFDECVERNGKDCNATAMWVQVPFFCGHNAECWVPGSKWALETAKQNLVDKYLLVGLTEELDDFVSILENLLPVFFRGAIDILKNGENSHLRKTFNKTMPSGETLEKFKRNKVWRMETEFYQFAKRQFRFVKNHLFSKKDNTGTVHDKIRKSNGFHYEKIKPILPIK